MGAGTPVAFVVPESTTLTGEMVLSLARNATAAIFGSHQRSNCQSAPAPFIQISFWSDAQFREWTQHYVTGPEGQDQQFGFGLMC